MGASTQQEEPSHLSRDQNPKPKDLASERASASNPHTPVSHSTTHLEQHTRSPGLALPNSFFFHHLLSTVQQPVQQAAIAATGSRNIKRAAVRVRCGTIGAGLVQLVAILLLKQSRERWRRA